MPSLLNEAMEWLDRAEQAREAATQLTDPDARGAVLELADSVDRLARAAASPAVARRRELARHNQR
jgi:predicted RecB family endonuclease